MKSENDFIRIKNEKNLFMKTREIIKFSMFESFGDANIGIEKEQKENIVKFLKKLQSNEFILFTKIWNFHWLIVSENFGPTHKFFGDLYESFFERIDEVAERIRILGEIPLGSLKDLLDKADLKEFNDDNSVPQEKEMYKSILEDYEIIIKDIRKFLDDEKVDNGTTNYLEDLIMKLEKDAWMIRSHLD